jgi:hypothetical protein
LAAMASFAVRRCGWLGVDGWAMAVSAFVLMRGSSFGFALAFAAELAGRVQVDLPGAFPYSVFNVQTGRYKRPALPTNRSVKSTGSSWLPEEVGDSEKNDD